MNDYLRRDLGYETDLVYRPLEWSVHPWDYSSHQNQYVNMTDELRIAIRKNPDLRVVFLCGYYDFATPYFDCENTVAKLGLAPELRGNVTIENYEAGHMMYVREVDHAKLKADLVTFIDEAVSPRK
ncbi:MAG: peptidase S10, partial [Acidobacteriota bacterium]